MGSEAGGFDRRVSAVVLDTVSDALRVHGALTRAQLIDRTGLSRPSVSAAITQLLSDDLIELTADDRTDGARLGRGRPSSLVRLNSRRAEAIGIELGRGQIAVAIVDATGVVVATSARPVDPTDALVGRAELAMNLAEELCRNESIDRQPLRRVAVGTPGPHFRPGISDAAGDYSLARLTRERAAVAQRVTGRWQVRVDVDNNTRFTAMAEAERRGRAGTDLVYLRLDEGIGGGIVTDGRLASGAWGAAGEIGHVSVDPAGRRCPCGGRGCFELLAGLPAVVTAAGAGDPQELIDRADEPPYREAIDDAARLAGRVVAGVLSVVNPAVLVIGGRVGLLPGFIAGLEGVVRDAAPAWATTDLQIERAHSDDLLSAIGAATAAYRNLRSSSLTALPRWQTDL